MRAVRDVWSELVERRLWPVALLLAVALVALPIVLAKKPAGDQAPVAATATPAVGAAAPAPGEPVVSVSTGGGGDAPLLGHWKDPFKAPPKPASNTSASTTATAGGTPTGSGTSSNGSGSNGGSPGRTAKPAPRTYVYASVDVHFGRAGRPLTEIKDIPRLAPLPRASEPIVIFMGTRADHETAVFMLSTDVKAQGDGRCVPSKKTCEAIELRRGGVALLDVTENTGSVTQYELDLDDVALHTTTSEAKANAAFARSSAAGRAALARSAFGAALERALGWSPSSGVLTATQLPWLERDGASPVGDSPEASAGAVQGAPVLTPLP